MKVLNVDHQNRVLTLARLGESEKDDLVIVMSFGGRTLPRYRLPMWRFDHSMEIGNLPESSVLILKKAP